ncbi:hypothetical protein HDU96_001961 [Phlyctochytrium bullatum]|nr:hypothetical protein HDU96_001961 [Phlyctochytrium bullatum]
MRSLFSALSIGSSSRISPATVCGNKSDSGGPGGGGGGGASLAVVSSDCGYSSSNTSVSHHYHHHQQQHHSLNHQQHLTTPNSKPSSRPTTPVNIIAPASDTCPSCNGVGYLDNNEICLMCPGPSLASLAPTPSSRPTRILSVTSPDHTLLHLHPPAPSYAYYSSSSSSPSPSAAPTSRARSLTRRTSTAPRGLRLHRRTDSPALDLPAFSLFAPSLDDDAGALDGYDSDQEEGDGDADDGWGGCDGYLSNASSCGGRTPTLPAGVGPVFAKGRSRVSRKAKGNRHNHFHGHNGIVEA